MAHVFTHVQGGEEWHFVWESSTNKVPDFVIRPGGHRSLASEKFPGGIRSAFFVEGAVWAAACSYATSILRKKYTEGDKYGVRVTPYLEAAKSRYRPGPEGLVAKAFRVLRTHVVLKAPDGTLCRLVNDGSKVSLVNVESAPKHGVKPDSLRVATAADMAAVEGSAEAWRDHMNDWKVTPAIPEQVGSVAVEGERRQFTQGQLYWMARNGRRAY